MQDIANAFVRSARGIPTAASTSGAQQSIPDAELGKLSLEDGQETSYEVNGARKRIVLVLFRNDLRIHDNAALYHAYHHAKKPTHILPVYCFDERQIECSGLPDYKRKGGEARTRVCGFWRTGVFRARLLAEAVYDLRHRLRDQGSDLMVRFGFPETAIENIVKALQETGDEVVGLEMQKEICSEEVRVEKSLKRRLSKLGYPDDFIRFHDTKHMVHVDDLPFKVKDTPDIFTPFRKKVEGLGDKMVRDLLELPEKLLPCPDINSIKDEGNYGADLNCEGIENVLAYFLSPLKGSYEMKYADPSFSKHKSSAFPWAGGESSALERLEWYFKTGNPPPVSNYKQTRNMLLGHHYSTKMSPFLCIGCISPRLISKCLDSHEKQYGSGQNTYWVRFELLWRDYFLFVSEKFGDNLFKVEGFEAITDPKMAAKKKDEWNWWDPDNYLLKAWIRGRTGIPFIDANIVELRETGFMSNRGRQNVASFLTKDLYFDWRIGAEFFESHLIDYDPTANWGNWQYVAGTGNDPRASRQFNPVKQAKDYDPAGEYVRTWITQLKNVPASKVHTPWLMSDQDWAKYLPSPTTIISNTVGDEALRPTIGHVKQHFTAHDMLSGLQEQKGTIISEDGEPTQASGDRTMNKLPTLNANQGKRGGQIVRPYDYGNYGKASSAASNAGSTSTNRSKGSAVAEYATSNSNSTRNPSNAGSAQESSASSAHTSDEDRSPDTRLQPPFFSPGGRAGTSSFRSGQDVMSSLPASGGQAQPSLEISKEAHRIRNDDIKQHLEVKGTPDMSQSATQLTRALPSSNDYSSATPYPRAPLFEQDSWKAHYYRKDYGRKKGGAGGGNSRRLIRTAPEGWDDK